jgi:LPXTG-motif cell wall-anchored protein
MWEKEAPAGYKKTDAMYRLVIGYTQSRMYLVAGDVQTEADVIDNTPLGALKLTKTVQVDGAAPTAANRAKTSGVYTFTVSGLGETGTAGVTRTVSITFADGKATRYQIDSGVEVTIPEAEATDNSWTVTVPDLVPGTYTVGETLPENGMTLKSVNAGTKVEGELAFVTVVAGDTAAAQESALATFVNNYRKADVKIVKIDENTRTGAVQEKLSGAVFTLVRGDEDPETHQVSYNAIYPNANDGVRRTDDQGELTFEDLPDGHYRLQETGVPDGYVLTSDPYIYFTITDGALSWTDSSGKPITDGQEHNKVTCDMAEKTFTVGNEPGVSLPATGGHGTLPYTIVGTLLILCALAIAVDKRRRQGNS